MTSQAPGNGQPDDAAADDRDIDASGDARPCPGFGEARASWRLQRLAD